MSLSQVPVRTDAIPFRQSDIVTIPSQWPEPLGAVALEAMSAGAAVIASSVGGLNDTLVQTTTGSTPIPATSSRG